MKLPTLLCLFVWLCLPLHAKDLAAYRIGDVAEADLTTPVPLDVVDTTATALLQSARAQQYPSIFRSFPDATNAMARNFLAAFDQARTNFLADLAIEFHSAKVDEATIASADFGRLVTVYGVENKSFPISDDLAGEWARGGDGQAIREKLLAALVWTANRHVRPDALPEGMTIGDTIRLVPVTDVDQKLSFETVQQGQLAPAGSLTTLANAQVIFRREFKPEQQLFAQALAAFLQPNCFPDAPFTQLTRGSAVYKLVVSDHYDAGDPLVHRGEAIDTKIKAALTALNEKLAARPPAAATAMAQPKPSTFPPPMATPAPPPPASKPATVVAQSLNSTPPGPTLKTGVRHERLMITLIGISAGGLFVAGWQIWKERKRAQTAAPPQTALLFPDAAKKELTPQVAQAVREAVQQELAQQRHDLLLAQQAATDEISALVHRLDELQVPMQERLHTYETRIQALEKELALRNEENRQLLKLKIEMVSRQLENERAGGSTTTITA